MDWGFYGRTDELRILTQIIGRSASRCALTGAPRRRLPLSPVRSVVTSSPPSLQRETSVGFTQDRSPMATLVPNRVGTHLIIAQE